MIHLKKGVFDGTTLKLLSIYGSDKYLVSRTKICGTATICLSSSYGKLGVNVKQMSLDRDAVNWWKEAGITKWGETCLHKDVKHVFNQVEIKANPKREPTLRACAKSFTEIMTDYYEVFKDLQSLEQDVYINAAVLQSGINTNEVNANQLETLAQKGNHRTALEFSPRFSFEHR